MSCRARKIFKTHCPFRMTLFVTHIRRPIPSKTDDMTRCTDENRAPQRRQQQQLHDCRNTATVAVDEVHEIEICTETLLSSNVNYFTTTAHMPPTGSSMNACVQQVLIVKRPGFQSFNCQCSSSQAVLSRKQWIITASEYPPHVSFTHDNIEK